MSTKALLLGLLSILFMDEASAALRIKNVSLITADPDFIDRSLTRVGVNSVLNSISLQIFLLKEFPRTVTFNMLLYKSAARGLKNDLGSFSSRMCDACDPTNKHLPRFVKKLTTNGKCGGQGQFVYPMAGLYTFPSLKNLGYRLPYLMISSNEIANGSRTILKYDVTLQVYRLH